MISDKEVGELWRWLHKTQVPTPLEAKAIMLVRKLIEERARAYKVIDMSVHRERYDSKYNLELRDKALRDFGIDPATFKEEP